jgi:hypothetical protein
LAINAAQYANVTVYQYVTYAGDRVTVRETIDPSRCPYPGLETFRTSEAKYFAGREDDVAELEAKLRVHNICGVIAASGAGKSSLVHAGLIPAFANRETEAWDVFAFKPGQEPLYGLARSMSGVLAEAETRKGQFDEIDATVTDLRETPGRLRRYIDEIISRRANAADGKHHHVLIFVDQWEELYTRENDEDRDILVRELMDVAERGLAKVLLTMRIDFMDDLVSKSTEFYDVLEPAVRILRPLSDTGRRAAIEKPAEVAGLGVPPELTSRLVADLGKDEGTLPYLQFVLRQLWEKRAKETNSLTTATYDSMDGLKGAIGAHADDVFRKLSKEEKGLAQRVLPRLANVSDTGITSRRLPFADFDEPARKLLRKLAEPERRLIVLSSATEKVADAEIVAEVAHEALLDDWKTLSGWIDDRKDFFRLRNKLEADSKTWVENERRNDLLISAGKPLFDAEEFRNDVLDGEISETLEGYLRVSFKKDRSRRWTRGGVVAALLLFAIGVATYFADLNHDLQASNSGLEQQTRLAEEARLDAEASAEQAEVSLAAEKKANLLAEEQTARAIQNQARAEEFRLSNLIGQSSNIRSVLEAISQSELEPSDEPSPEETRFFGTAVSSVEWVLNQPWKFDFSGTNWRMITSFGFSPQGNYLMVGRFATSAAMIDSTSKRVVRNHQGIGSKVFNNFSLNDAETLVLTHTGFQDWAVFPIDSVTPIVSGEGCSTEGENWDDQNNRCKLNSISFGHSSIVIAATTDGMRVFDVEEDGPIRKLGQGSYYVPKSDPSGRWISGRTANTSSEKEERIGSSLFVWDLENIGEATEFKPLTYPAGEALGVFVNERKIIVAASGHPLRLIDLEHQKTSIKISDESFPTFKVHSQQDLIAIIESDGQVRVVDLQGRVNATWSSSLLRNPRRISFFNDLLVAGLENGNIAIFDLSSGKVRKTIYPDSGSIIELDISEEQRLLSAQFEDDSVMVWEIDSVMGVNQTSLNLRPYGIRSLFFSSQIPVVFDDGVVATATDDEIVLQYGEFLEANEILEIPGLVDNIGEISAFGSDGLIFEDGDTCKTFSLRTRSIIHEVDDCSLDRFHPQSGLVIRKSTSSPEPNNTFYISSSDGSESYQIEELDGADLKNFEFSPDGSFVVSVDNTNNVLLAETKVSAEGDYNRTIFEDTLSFGWSSPSGLWAYSFLGGLASYNVEERKKYQLADFASGARIFADDEHRWLAFVDGPTVSIFDTLGGGLRQTIDLSFRPSFVTFSGSDTLILGTEAGLVEVWYIDSKEIAARLDLGLQCGPLEFDGDKKECLVTAIPNGSYYLLDVMQMPSGNQLPTGEAVMWSPFAGRTEFSAAEAIRFSNLAIVPKYSPSANKEFKLCNEGWSSGNIAMIQWAALTPVSVSDELLPELLESCLSSKGQDLTEEESIQLATVFFANDYITGARVVLEEASLRGSALASSLLGDIVYFNLAGDADESVNIEEGLRQYANAARAGDATGLFNEALHLMESGDESGYCRMEQLAKGGEPRAKLALAFLYSAPSGSLANLPMPTFGGRIAWADVIAPNTSFWKARELAAQATVEFENFGATKMASLSRDLNFSLTRAIGTGAPRQVSDEGLICDN